MGFASNPSVPNGRTTVRPDLVRSFITQEIAPESVNDSRLLLHLLLKHGVTPSALSRLSQEARGRGESLIGFFAWWVERAAALAAVSEQMHDAWHNRRDLLSHRRS